MTGVVSPLPAGFFYRLDEFGLDVKAHLQACFICAGFPSLMVEKKTKRGHVPPLFS